MNYFKTIHWFIWAVNQYTDLNKFNYTLKLTSSILNHIQPKAMNMNDYERLRMYCYLSL